MNIDQSVRALLKQRKVIVRLFYNRLLDRYPEIRDYFAGIDLDQQAIMLTMALVIVENHFSHNYPATRHYLKVLGHQHHLRGIAAELYPTFRDCLLETLAEFHKDHWDADVAGQWHDALDKAWQTMREGYRKPYLF